MSKACQRILGLDIGIASIGWAIVDYDKEDRSQNKIIKSGVRIFTQAEHPKDGSSLSLPRRLARGARRNLKRKRQRMKSIKRLFMTHLKLIEKDLFVGEVDKTIYSEKGRDDVWKLRANAVQRELNNKEFARVLTHIAKRRGYKSNRKVDEQGDSEGKKVLGAIEHNKALLEKYTTIGQAIYETNKEKGVFRNKDDDYSHSVSREMLLDEVKTIFKKQQEFGNPLATDELKEKYIEIAFFQRDFTSVDCMVGKCSLEKDEPRAAKRTYSAEEFVTLTKLINTKIVLADGSERGLIQNELEKIISLCKQSEKPSYIKIRETIGLAPDSNFKNIEEYEVDKKTGEILNNKPTKFTSAFKGYHQLRLAVTKALSKLHWHNMSQDTKLLDEIATIFSIHKSDEKIREALDALTFSMFDETETATVKEALISSISFDKFIYLSLKALDNVLPYMREGKRYDEAVVLAGYKREKSGTQQKFLRALTKEEQNELTNPVVKRAIAQTRKVINALIREYGQFDSVHIELTREIKKSHKDRKKIEDGQKKYQEFKEKVVEDFKQLFDRDPKGNELLKFRLWKEQDGYCAYSGFMGEKGYIKPEQLLADVKYAEIDHILPYSRSLDDSLNNKVLCLAKENQEKKNMTPFEYFQSIGRDWNSYEVHIKAMKGIHRAKRNRLLKKNFDENSEKEFRERNINDTAYMARFIKNFIEDNLELTGKEKRKVITINGALTNMLRHNWGVGNKSRDTHLHHAVDAIIIAFATQSEVQRLSTQAAKIDGFGFKKSAEKSKKFRFMQPMENFRDEVQKSIDGIFVSFSPRRKVTGAAHKETIYSKKLEKVKGSFEINGGVAENGEVKRVDVFIRDGKYHFVFLYPADFEKDKLPNRTIKGVEIDESFEFILSLFKDELIELKAKNKESFRGYLKFVESDGRFNLQKHWQSEYDKKIGRFSTGSLEYLKKYQVDVLGKITEIKKETRVSTKKVLRKHKIKQMAKKK